VPCSSAAIEKPGEAQSAISDVVSRTTGRSAASHEKNEAEAKKEKKAERPREKKAVEQEAAAAN
jgi:hypothetical protein